MNTVKERPDWIRDKKTDPEFEVIRVPEWDDYRDFKIDDGCYVLIRIYRDRHEIGVGICNYEHVLLKEFRGRRSQDLYTAIFQHGEQKGRSWFRRMDHAAYLGKELKKAEICMAAGSDYYQE